MSENWKYRPKTEEDMTKKFTQLKPKSWDEEEFLRWYYYSPKKCHYCGLQEEELQEIVHRGILRSSRFRFQGLSIKGRTRGYWLEIDRKKPKEPYSRENCVLSCYFCNNDKSDVFDEKQYLEFMNDRVGFLRGLLNRNMKS